MNQVYHEKGFTRTIIYGRLERWNGSNMYEEILALSPELEPAYINDEMVIYSFPNRWNESETTDVTIHEKTITVRTVIKKEGLNKHSGKAWKNWTSPYSVIFSLKQEKYGKPILRVYESKKIRGRRGRLFLTVTAERVQALMTLAETLHSNGESRNREGRTAYYYQPRMEAQVEELILRNLLHKYRQLAKIEEEYPATSNNVLMMAYPASKLFLQVRNLKQSLTYANAVWCKQDDVRVFLKENYGKKAVRKDVIKALASMTDARSAVVASYFHRYVPVDWLIPLFTNPEKYYIISAIPAVKSSKFVPELRKLLSLATPPQRKRLLHESAKESSEYNRTHLLQDVTRLLADMSHEYIKNNQEALKFDNWNALHDSLSIMHRRRNMQSRAVPQKGLSKHLDGAKVIAEEISYVVRAPKTSLDLLDWGNTLNNCIASYSNQVVEDRTKVFALYSEKGNKLYANLEYRQGRVIQFVSNNNVTVPLTVQEAFAEVLKVAENKVEKEEEARKAKYAKRKIKDLIEA